jgi:hypothetical protein
MDHVSCVVELSLQGGLLIKYEMRKCFSPAALMVFTRLRITKYVSTHPVINYLTSRVLFLDMMRIKDLSCITE